MTAWKWIFSLLCLSAFFYGVWIAFERDANTIEFSDNKIKLGLGFTAKSFCSCLFVARNSEDVCLDFSSLDVVSPSLTVDYEKKRTKSTLFLFFSREARFIDDEHGCVLL